MIHPNLKQSWVEWESGPNGVSPVVVIETDIPLEPGPEGMNSSALDDMIHEALEHHSQPNHPIHRARIVPVGKHSSNKPELFRL